GGLLWLDDRVLAHANRRAEALEDEVRGNPSHTTNILANANWLADRDGRIYYYRAFDIPEQTLHGLSIFTPAPSGSHLESHTMATRAVYAGGVWQAGRGWTQMFPE